MCWGTVKTAPPLQGRQEEALQREKGEIKSTQARSKHWERRCACVGPSVYPVFPKYCTPGRGGPLRVALTGVQLPQKVSLCEGVSAHAGG